MAVTIVGFCNAAQLYCSAAEDVAEEAAEEAETVEEAVEEPVFAGEDELVLYNEPGVDEPSVIHGVQFNNILTEVDSVNGYGSEGYNYSNATLRNSAYYYYDLYDEADYDGTKYVFNGGAESNSFDAGADDTAVKQRIAEKNTDGDKVYFGAREQVAGQDGMENSYRLVVFDDQPFNLLKTITYTSTIYTRIGYKYISSATTPDWYAGSGAREPKMDLANKAYVETYYVKGDPDSNATLTLAYRTIVKSGDKATNSTQTFKIPAKALKTDTYSKVDIYTAGYMSGGTERVVISVFVDGVFMDKKDYVKPWNEFYGIEYDDIYFNIENTGLTRMQQADKTSATAYVTAWTDTVANRTRGVDFSVSQTAGFQVVEHNAAASTSLSGNLPSGFPAESIATPATISVTGVKPEYAASFEQAYADAKFAWDASLTRGEYVIAVAAETVGDLFTGETTNVKVLNNDGTEIDNPSASAAAISDVYFLMNGVYFTAVYEQTSGVEAAYIDEIKNATADGVFLEGVATVGDLFTEATAVIDGKAVTATDGDGAAIEDLGASTVPLTDATFTYNGVTFRILTYQKLNSKTAETGTTARTSVYKVDEAAFNEGVTDGRTMGGLEYGYSRITADVYGGYAISRGDTKYGSAGYYTLYSSGADRSAYESLTAVQNLYIPSYNEGTLHINICIGASNSTSGNYKTVNVYLFTNEAMYVNVKSKCTISAD